MADSLVNPRSVMAGDINMVMTRGMFIGLLPAALVYISSYAMVGRSTVLFWLDEPVWVLLSILVVSVASHELMHLIVSPGVGLHPKNVIGFETTTYVPYVSVYAPMSKSMAIAHLLAPTCLITPLALLGCAALDGKWAGSCALLATINTASSGADWLLAWWTYKRLGPSDRYQAGYFGELLT